MQSDDDDDEHRVFDAEFLIIMDLISMDIRAPEIQAGSSSSRIHSAG